MFNRPTELYNFILESNRIEGIHGMGEKDYEAHEKFLQVEKPRIPDLQEFVHFVAGAELRSELGMNVTVGNYTPPMGGPDLVDRVASLLQMVTNAPGAVSPYKAHKLYEALHPFMDGNGRSGRVLWAWHMRAIGEDPFSLSFLHRWYYQSLAENR